MLGEVFRPQKIEAYFADGRRPIEELEKEYLRLEKDFGWKKETLCVFTSPSFYKPMPVSVYHSQAEGCSIGLLGGIHGEESSSPNAFAERQNLELIGKMGQKIPMFVIPLCNPIGYLYNWRYCHIDCPNKWGVEGVSIGSSDHLLPNPDNSIIPRLTHPESTEAAVFTQGIISLIEKYPPLLTINFHEDLKQDDDSIPDCYIYSQGTMGANDPIAKSIVRILRNYGFQIIENGHTGVKDIEIKNGIARRPNGEQIRDGSIDEFFASDRYFQEGTWHPKFPTPHVIVSENSIDGFPLSKRNAVKTEIIRSLPEFWRIVKK